MTTVTLNPGYLSSRSAIDWGFALLALLGTVFAFTRYQQAMDEYEQAIHHLQLAGRDLVGLVLAAAAHIDAGGHGLVAVGHLPLSG